MIVLVVLLTNNPTPHPWLISFLLRAVPCTTRAQTRGVKRRTSDRVTRGTERPAPYEQEVTPTAPNAPQGCHNNGCCAIRVVCCVSDNNINKIRASLFTHTHHFHTHRQTGLSEEDYSRIALALRELDILSSPDEESREAAAAAPTAVSDELRKEAAAMFSFKRSY